MKHIVYGYEIVDGKAIIVESKAEQVKLLFNKYLEGESLAKASKSSFLNLTHSQIANMLDNQIYCSNEFYPAIISIEVFKKVEEERKIRAKRLGRLNRVKARKIIEPIINFKWNPVTQNNDDPFEQAKYLYSLIEVEE